MIISKWLSAIAVAGVLALPIIALGDYVADDSEIAAMKSKILKSPPTAETLTAPPYPGSQLDAECSADQSATNRADPMVYCLYTRDSLDKVKAYLAGPGKPAAWVSVFADKDDVAVKGQVTVPDVTQVRYFVSAKRKAAAQAAAANPPPAPPASAAAATSPATTTQGTASTASAAEPAATADKSDATPTAEKAVETVNKLKGLFGR
jgi:pyruvate/2-oxoglutarate dehydrogenase complex dihydrolipoamide acyltransferase (E2) component